MFLLCLCYFFKIFYVIVCNINYFCVVKQSKHEVASLRTKKIAYFDEMLVLFARDRASGAHAETAKERNARLNKNEKIQV